MKTLFLSSPDRLLMMASLIANVNSALIDVRRRQEVVQIRRQKVAQTPFQGV